MEISNRALAIMLLAAVVVSLGGTIISLNRLGNLSATGFATTDLGYINVNITDTLSISTQDSDTINFGSCEPGGAAIIINSEGGFQTVANCTGFSNDNISVRNIGNVDANVTISFSNVGKASGGTFLDSASSTSEIAYKIQNYSRDAGSSGGCSGTYWQENYTNASASATKFIACSNLTFGEDQSNSFVTQFQIIVPFDVPSGQQNVTVTYTGHPIV